MQNIRGLKGGFALPTVLIASIVLFTILTASVSSVVAVRTALMTQYYEQLAKTAGEAGVAYAKACLAKNGNIPLWTDAKPLTPASDCAGNTLLDPEVQVLVVGGGAGGGNNHGGGGGGGGVTYVDSFDVSVRDYTVTVGAGGAGGTTTLISGRPGSGSAFDTINVLGGGGGSGRITTNSVSQPGDGASGGGGAGTADAVALTPDLGGNGTPGQGNDGGSGMSGATAGNAGGGGGAGKVGGDASSDSTASGAGTSGTGGDGFMSDIAGNTIYYGAGGSGGRWGAGKVGLPGITGGGIGGNADSVAGSNGVANTGAGGGGGGGANANGGAGGSGVVVVRYSKDGSVTATTTGTVDSYTSGAYQVKVFKTSGLFKVTAVGVATCPSAPRCSVTIDGNTRSSFKVGIPTLNNEGKAVAIPNTGYVELLRESNGQVWRTYRQPSVQAAVVPDLCSGAATSSLGWSNAEIATTQGTLPNALEARNITLAADNLAAGQIYFRRDFPVMVGGTYTVNTTTPSGNDKIELYVDGTSVATAQGSLKSGNINLTAGCHTITARLTNKTISPRPSSFIAAIQQNTTGATPILVSDSDWRVSSGAAVDFSQSDFYVDPDMWTNVYNYDAAANRLTSWPSAAGDPYTQYINTNHSGCPTLCPFTSYTYLRDSRDFILASDTQLRVSALCDDDCSVYMDGNLIIESSPWPNLNQQTLTVNAGSHRLAVREYNGGAAPGVSGVAVSAYDIVAGAVVARTDNRWQAANSWFPGTTGEVPFSYEASFQPSPVEIATPKTIDVLVVAGGGGGGGNCVTCAGAGGGGGGGLIYSSGITATTGAFTVTVGAGGTSGAGGASRTNGGNGGNSVFGSLTAIGGGGGGAQNGVPGNNGGSGGGGSGGSSPAAGAGGAGTSGQGGAGGAGASASLFFGGGGGGAAGWGVPGTTTTVGYGAPGYLSYFNGSLLTLGAGGGGGSYSSSAGGSAEVTSGGVGGSIGVTRGNGIANTGGGGGGANGTTGGTTGGTGGSGLVMIRFKTGAITVGTITGLTYTPPSNVIISGVSYTVYKFTAGTGTFNITAVN